MLTSVTFVGTRLQEAGSKDTEEDVVGEHEDEADRFRHCGCDHRAHHLDRLQ
jgi:hypothetical protein